MNEPPRSFEEFLRFQKLADWPRHPEGAYMDVNPLIATLRKDYSFCKITKYLHDNAPLSTENLSSLEKRVEECKTKVREHAEKINLKCEEKMDQEQAVEPSATDSKDISVIRKKKKKVEFDADITQRSRCKRAENCKFPGFQTNYLTDLPNQLEAVQLWDSVLKVQTIKGINLKVLKKLFFSEASVAILQDCFWWWFLQKFEMYPDCLSQAIYLTFCEAFPKSHFGDMFKDELMDLIFQWIRGFKPQKFAWKKWNLLCSEKPVNHVTRKESVAPSFLSLSPKGGSKSLRFLLAPDKDDSLKIETPKPVKQSHYAGDGPDFHRSHFNLGGQSPLVSYYLKMHGISNTLQNSRLYKITHTEICKEPPASPTYQDVIERSQKFTKNLHDDFLDCHHSYDDELAELEEQRKIVDRKFRSLLAKVSKNPHELRLRTQALVQELENQKQGLTPSSAVKKPQH